MPHETTILENEVGIQYQGVKNSSSIPRQASMGGLMIGTFKRGRLDRPMTITNENIRGELGHDPENPHYIAVQDALASGIPSIQVLRTPNTKDIDTGGGVVDGEISCAGATQVMSMFMVMRSELSQEDIAPVLMAAKVIINDVSYKFMDMQTGAFSHLLIPEMDQTSTTNIPAGYVGGPGMFKNISSNSLRIKFDFTENNENHDALILPPTNIPTNNPTYYQGADKRVLTVCLAPSDGLTCAVLGDCQSSETIPTNVPDVIADRYTHYYLSWIQEENGVQTTVTAKKYWTINERALRGLFNSIIAMGGLSKLGESKNGETPEYSLFTMVDGQYIQGFDNTNTFESFYGCIKPGNFRPMSINFIPTPLDKITELSGSEPYVDYYQHINSSKKIKTCGYQPVVHIVDNGMDYSRYPDI